MDVHYSSSILTLKGNSESSLHNHRNLFHHQLNVETCIHGVKSATYLSKVSCVDWKQSLPEMKMISPSEKKSRLYEEGPVLPWGEKEWMLYNIFKHNARRSVTPVLQECHLDYQQYQEWITTLSEAAVVQPAFYPYGLSAYSVIDFLFKSHYQKQVVNIFQLPSTGIFFSIDEYLLVRASILNERERDNLFKIISHLKEYNYITEHLTAFVVSTSSGDFRGQNNAAEKTAKLSQNL